LSVTSVNVRAVHKVKILISVSIEIEDGDAAHHGLRLMFLRRGTAIADEMHSGAVRNLVEGDGRGRHGGCQKRDRQALQQTRRQQAPGEHDFSV
jgi:hypothetical protein